MNATFEQIRHAFSGIFGAIHITLEFIFMCIESFLLFHVRFTIISKTKSRTLFGTIFLIDNFCYPYYQPLVTANLYMMKCLSSMRNRTMKTLQSSIVCLSNIDNQSYFSLIIILQFLEVRLAYLNRIPIDSFEWSSNCGN
jgi:hypothetical protein